MTATSRKEVRQHEAERGKKLTPRSQRWPLRLALGLCLLSAAPTFGLQAAAVQPQIAETEAALAKLESLARQLETEAAAEAESHAEQVSEVVRLEAELRAARKGSEAAGALFDRAKELLSPAFDDLEAAMRRATAPSEVPGAGARRGPLFSTSEGPASGADRAAGEARRLTELEERLDVERMELAKLEKKLRRESMTRHGAYAARLWRLRLAALEVLPRARRAQLASLTRERWDEMAVDFEALRLVVRLRSLRLRQLLADPPRVARDLFTVIAAGAILARVALVALLWLWVHRRRARFLEILRRWAGGSARARVALELTAAAAPWATFLVGLSALAWAVGPEPRDLPALPVLFFLAVLYGGYRLAGDLLVAALAAPSGSTAFELSPESRPRLDRSVRRVLRVAVPALLVPIVYANRLEGGVLYDALRGIAFWAILIAVVVELGSWRRELAAAYLALGSSGPWAGLLRRARDRPAGFLAAPFTFLLLVARGVYSIGYEIASGHEGTRAAAAYLARRRIEREAQKRGHADVDLARLPADLAAGLDETVRAGDLDVLDSIPGLDEVRRSLEDWRQGGRGGACLVAGEEGAGKHAWLDRLCELEPVTTRLTLDRRLVEPADLLAWLEEALLAEDGGPESRAGLVDRLLAGEPRIVILEASENLFLTRVNGYRGLDELAWLADKTRQRVYWLLSMESLAFQHLKATWKGLAVLRRVVELPEWSEAQIRQLLGRRLAAAGYTVRFAQLLGQPSEGEGAAARERAAERAYFSLLSDFADGNPGVALHYFLRSLAPAAERELSVRPFQLPVANELAEMSDEAHFVLAAMVRHGGLTLEELPTVTACPARQVGILLTRLADLGTVADDDGRYRVTTGWHPAVHRLLHRRNILIS